ncbi:MAG: hypothetical protein KDA76_04250 [Planctomycetaceae bacterium]|nr:hypothetical protein [Planctomycetaceae bacterium]
MSEFLTIKNGRDFVSIMVDAVELPDLKLDCEITCEPEVVTSSGEAYAPGLIKVLCIDGMRVARRKLSIPDGLQVTVSAINGTLEKSNEVGVCHATGLAIAKALKKDDSPIITSMSGWIVADD